ncbi:MAG TPA: Flp pilus assembly protein CpaB [Myxococcales bacterium]|jgi:pilus assembly protein CpaB
MAEPLDRLTAAPRKPPRPHGSGLRAVAFLAMALVAALGAGLLFSRYLDRRGATGVPTVRVVVAAADLPVATTLRPDLLAAVEWPKAYAPQGAAREPAALSGKVTTAPIAKGEAILPSRLATGDLAQGLAAVLPDEMRAVAVRVDDVVGVAGFVHPGDRVDVIVTIKPREDSDALHTSKVILQNVKVLSVGKDLDHKAKAAEKAVPVTVATLMVSVPDSERLALASTKGQILLALRGGADARQYETEGVTPPELVGERAQAPLPRPAAAPPPPAPPPATATGARPVPARAVAPKKAAAAPVAPPPAPPSREVEILRGDRFEKREFRQEEATP